MTSGYHEAGRSRSAGDRERAVSLRGRNLITIDDFSNEENEAVLDAAAEMESDLREQADRLTRAKAGKGWIFYSSRVEAEENGFWPAPRSATRTVGSKSSQAGESGA